MRKANPDTHQACRSLLQKAVRRGHPKLAAQTAAHLLEVGDSKWLQRRTAVIIVEECWPLLSQLQGRFNRTSASDVLAQAASSTKNKNEAGLGTLAYALSQGDRTVLGVSSEQDQHIRIMAAAINRQEEFWAWAKRESAAPWQHDLVTAARRAFRRGGWPWDRAFLQAAAYLAVSTPVAPKCAATTQTVELPLWVALDKHTQEGKQALRHAARITGVPVKHAMWASFYLESATTNEQVEAVWWTQEVSWRLSRIGLDLPTAECLWGELRPAVISQLESSAEQLKRHVAAVKHTQPMLL